MKRLGLSIAIVLLAAIPATAFEAEETPLPEIWTVIEREGKTLVEKDEETAMQMMGGFSRHGPMNLRLEWAARRLGERYDRSAIETLLRSVNSAEDLLKRNRQTADLSARLIAEIADPKNEHGLKSAQVPWGVRWHDSYSGISWHGVAIAAIDLYHDASSRDLLLDQALKQGEYRGAYGGPGAYRWGNPAAYALGFLRCYEAEEVRPKIEEALRDEEAETQLRPQMNKAYYAVRADYLRALLSSLEYSTGLKAPAQREDYRRFQRHLWRAWALAPRGFRGIGREYDHAAWILEKYWKEGDERFVLRIFEDPASTLEEAMIARSLAHRLSANDQKRLEIVAQGDSPKARIARQALELAAVKSKRGDR